MKMTILPTGQAHSIYARILETDKTSYPGWNARIARLRQLFEKVFREITASENILFSNVHARILFVTEKYQLDKALVDEIHGFRRFGNKVTHQEQFQASEQEYKTCVSVLAQTISKLSVVPVPAELSAIYENNPRSFSWTGMSGAEEIPFITAVVKSSTPVKSNDKGSKYFTLLCMDIAGDLGDFTVTLWDHYTKVEKSIDNLLTQYANLLGPFVKINLSHLKKTGSASNHYSSSILTHIVIEPDYLLDASDIAECFQFSGNSYLLYFIGKLVSGEAGEAAFKGKLVNDQLDVMIKERSRTFDEVFRESVSENALQAIKFGRQSLATIRTSIMKEHYDNLKKVVQQIDGKKVIIEPTFFSAKYGLSGRLDALLIDPENKDHMDVFELKSGKCPPGDPWPNNAYQVTCYNMLIESMSGGRRTGVSSIFYSQAPEGTKILKDVPHFSQREQNVLDIRNRIVAAIYAMANNNFSLLREITPENMSSAPVFKKDDVHKFSYLYNFAGNLEREYYCENLAFVMRELIAAKTGAQEYTDREEEMGFASLWLEDAESKMESNRLIPGLLFEDFEPVEDVLTFRIREEVCHNFREGDIALIYPKAGTIARPLNHQIFKGSVKSLRGNRLLFALRNRQLEKELFSGFPEWYLEHDIYESNYWAQVNSLLDFLKGSDKMRNLLLCLQKPGVSIVEYKPDPELTETQNRVVRKALEAKDYFLIQGPPGTGKTSTVLTRIVRELRLRNHEQALVVLAFTNRAIDEIARNLKEREIDYLRLGHSREGESENISSKARETGFNDLTSWLLSKRIILSTVSTFQNRCDDIMELLHPETILIDEASQLTESALAGIVSRFRKFILIGDQNQLPSVVIQSEKYSSVKSAELKSCGLSDLRNSLFERLFQQAMAKNQVEAYDSLTDQYRMHEQLAALVQPFYRVELKAVKDRQREPFQYFRKTDTPLEERLASGRLLFIESDREQKAKIHEQEARRVARLLHIYKKQSGNLRQEDLGVITPFRAQIEQIRKAIQDEELLDLVSIDTIERYQGSQRRFIIVSLAINNAGRLTALTALNEDRTVDRKLNVMLSRAEEQLIILGCPQAIYDDPFYRRLMQQSRDMSGFVNGRTARELFGF